LSEKERTTATGNMYRKFGEVWTRCFRQASELTDPQTCRYEDRNTSHPFRAGEVNIRWQMHAKA